MIMVSSGDRAGLRLWLRDGQTLQVGRTELADCCIPEDELMSRLHFAVDSEQGVCRIRDLGSRNGTFINGELVKIANLKNGDTILAGRTEFQITIGARTHEPVSQTAPISNSAAPRVQFQVSSQSTLNTPIRLDGDDESTILNEHQSHSQSPPSYDETLGVPLSLQPNIQESARVGVTTDYEVRAERFEVVEGPNGLPAIHPAGGHTRPMDAVLTLNNQRGFHMLINVDKMETAAQSFFASPIQGRKFLRVIDNLVLISSDDEIDRLDLFCRAWGRDALIGLVSNLSKFQLADNLRSYPHVVRSPSVLLDELRRTAPEGQRLILTAIEALFLERDGAEDWLLMLNPESGLDWNDLGFSIANR